MKTGSHSGYFWLVSRDPLWFLHDQVLEHHLGLQLGITSFDSGPLTPNEDESALGWVVENGVMLSPTLTREIQIPHEQYDEWYIAELVSIKTSEIEIFVNYGGFSVVPPEVTYEEYDPSWERGGLDFLIPLQEQFWRQLTTLNPETYVALGDNKVVVSRNREFVDGVWQSHNKSLKLAPFGAGPA